MKKAITDAANEVMQTEDRTARNEWWDEECRQHIKRKMKKDLLGPNKTQQQAKKRTRSCE